MAVGSRWSAVTNAQNCISHLQHADHREKYLKISTKNEFDSILKNKHWSNPSILHNYIKTLFSYYKETPSRSSSGKLPDPR